MKMGVDFLSKAKASQADAVEQVASQPEEKAPEAVISFEDFLNQHPKLYNPGLVASFRYEDTRANALKPRTETEWVIGFEAQSNRNY